MQTKDSLCVELYFPIKETILKADAVYGMNFIAFGFIIGDCPLEHFLTNRVKQVLVHSELCFKI